MYVKRRFVDTTCVAAGLSIRHDVAVDSLLYLGLLSFCLTAKTSCKQSAKYMHKQMAILHITELKINSTNLFGVKRS